MTYAIDTNIVFDVLLADDEFGPVSREFLAREFDRGNSFLACDIVWAEASAGFPDKEEFRRRMADFRISFSPMPESASVRAGSIWKTARRELASAGKPRIAIVPDFLVAAHAMECADALVSRDRGFLRSWFTGLKVLDPMDV